MFMTIMMTRSSNTHSLVLWLSACEMDSLIRWSLLNRWLMVIVSCAQGMVIVSTVQHAFSRAQWNMRALGGKIAVNFAGPFFAVSYSLQQDDQGSAADSVSGEGSR